MKAALLAVPMLLASIAAQAKVPDCGAWYRTMTWVNFKNEGLIDADQITDDQGKYALIARQPLGKNLEKDVYHVTFPAKDGGTVQAIAVGESSSTECSGSNVNVYIVSKFISGGI